jgi:Uma2 family endonuclease
MGASDYAAGMDNAENQETSPALDVHGETRVLLHGISWDLYERLVEADPGVRLTYLRGVLEVMGPSRAHEIDKTLLARLLEAYAEEHDLELNGFGNATFRALSKEHGLEPDECYVLRSIQDREPYRPDLAIEIVYTSWKLDKLEVYRTLEVPEVWIWRRGVIEILALDDGRYQRRDRSVLLPDLDLPLLLSFMGRKDQVRAVKEYRAVIRARSGQSG